MVEVDLRLFVSCRLCLDVKGHFVIDSNVQQQIKYCFDIDVEPFDGLSQLICKKCEQILREHYAIKKKFSEKQKELKTKLQVNGRKSDKSPLPYQDESENFNNKTKLNNTSPSSNDCDSSNLRVDYHDKTSKKKKVKKKRIVNRISSSSNDDSDSNPPGSRLSSNSKKHSSVKDIPWDADLNKYFVCRICSLGFKGKEAITEHIKDHTNLEMKYKSVFKKSCLVAMEKIDSKPNLCNSNKAVVYSTDSIIQNIHNPFYYVMYHPKTYSYIPDNLESALKWNSTSFEHTESEKLTSRKRKRLHSGSSSETVVINPPSEHEDTSFNDRSNNPPTVIDCIDLGDSSDNESCESNGESCSSRNKGKLDSKPTENIIKMCHNRYTKHLESQGKKSLQHDKEKEELLNHKVLSIGRKIINNKGFNCTGLLRFLEYKDLSVIWKQTSALNASNDSKYVRIAIRVRGNENINTNNADWKDFCMFRFDNDKTCTSVTLFKKLKSLANFKKNPEVRAIMDEGENCEQKLPHISSVFSIEANKNDVDNQLHSNKLLNENPVSNPKQLPKKGSSNENYSKNIKESWSKNIKVFAGPSTVALARSEQVDVNSIHTEEHTNTMPIVISAVSLACLLDKGKTDPIKDSVIKKNNQTTHPIIKVKPITELMPEKMPINNNSNDTYMKACQNASQISSVMWNNKTVNLNQERQTWGGQVNSMIPVNNPQILDSVLSKPLPSLHFSNQNNTASVDTLSQSSESSDLVKEFIIMDTAEFPNKKTSSPFQYLKDLLLVHNIILLDTDQHLPKDSVTLVTLKVVYQQENCDKITLSLSLYCFKNYFCIQIKDLNHEAVHVSNLSANWQWQLLKVYNDKVINKVLQTASTINTETLQYTSHFFNLLRSIKVKNYTTGSYS